jgi:hypothetical protein
MIRGGHNPRWAAEPQKIIIIIIIIIIIRINNWNILQKNPGIHASFYISIRT